METLRELVERIGVARKEETTLPHLEIYESGPSLTANIRVGMGMESYCFQMVYDGSDTLTVAIPDKKVPGRRSVEGKTYNLDQNISCLRTLKIKPELADLLIECIKDIK